MGLEGGEEGRSGEQVEHVVVGLDELDLGVSVETFGDEEGKLF